MTRSVKHLPDDPLSTLPIINLLDDPLVDSFALATQTTRKLESRPFTLRHHEELLDNRFNKLDSAGTRLDMVVVVVSVLLNAMERIFKLVLPMGDKPRVFRCPGWMRRPFIIENTVAKLITATTRFLSLAFGQKTVARTERTAVGKVDDTRRLLGLEINDLIFRFVDVHESLEPRHQLWVRTNVSSCPFDENLSVDEIGGVKVAELEELAKRRLVSDVFLDTIKERKFFLCRRHRRRRLDWFWEGGDEGRRNSRSFTLRGLGMMNLGSLFPVSKHSTEVHSMGKRRGLTLLAFPT